MKKIKLLISLIICLNISFLNAQDDTIEKQIKESISVLIKALNENNYELIKPVLSEAFTYSGYKNTMANMIMRQVVGQYPNTISSIKISSIENKESQYYVKTILTNSKEIEELILVFDRDFKFIKAEVAKIELGKH